ncbi:MAG: hypothetical protein LC119_07185 [Burkholderiales bacterium]|nr:hypothetical protein [Burkholderiales bacterium]
MRITLIGYGEVGRILAEDLRAQDHALCAFDLALQGEQGEPMLDAELVISAGDRESGRAGGAGLRAGPGSPTSPTPAPSACAAARALRAAATGAPRPIACWRPTAGPQRTWMRRRERTAER